MVNIYNQSTKVINAKISLVITPGDGIKGQRLGCPGHFTGSTMIYFFKNNVLAETDTHTEEIMQVLEKSNGWIAF